MNGTMLKPPHRLVMSNSPETNSTKRVDEKRGRVPWPVEQNKQKRSKHSYQGTLMPAQDRVAHTEPKPLTTLRLELHTYKYYLMCT